MNALELEMLGRIIRGVSLTWHPNSLDRQHWANFFNTSSCHFVVLALLATVNKTAHPKTLLADRMQPWPALGHMRLRQGGVEMFVEVLLVQVVRNACYSGAIVAPFCLVLFFFFFPWELRW